MMDEKVARAIFTKAINEHRCGELLEWLFRGGTATIDVNTGKLVLVKFP